MKAKIHRVNDGVLVPYYSKAMARLGARLCGKDREHWAEAEINSIEELLQLADETALQVIVGWNFNKTCMDVTILDDAWSD